MDTYVVILAAGQGKRMKSNLYKVLHCVADKPMIKHVITTAQTVNPKEIFVVVGHGAEAVMTEVGDKVTYVTQEKQLGTGHAIRQVENILSNKEGLTIVMCGDTPLITKATINSLIDVHRQNRAAATVLTSITSNPYGYGRIVRSNDDTLVKIVEERDCTASEREISEINVATYCFDNKILFQALQQIKNNNAQEEYYLTDVIEVLKAEQKKVCTYCTPDFSETLGVNDRVQLAIAEKVMNKRISECWQLQGVTILQPETTYIGSNVKIGMDTVIYPGTVILGSSIIGDSCLIGPHSKIEESFIASNTSIVQSVVTKSRVAENANIGPFAHLRPGGNIGKEVRIGNFVEVKNAAIADRAKVPHLSYIGDATIGEDVNIGCGAITVNYDGQNKHHTNVQEGAFIGCNANLIAPVTIGKNAVVAAGSTLSEDVPENALIIERSGSVVKNDYNKKKRSKVIKD